MAADRLIRKRSQGKQPTPVTRRSDDSEARSVATRFHATWMSTDNAPRARPAPMDLQRYILSVQRTAGNRAVANRLVRDMKAVGPVAGDDLLTDLRRSTDGGPGAAPVQRTIGDGHDLRSGRFALNSRLEAAFDNESVIMRGATGSAVKKIQQALLDFGFRLPRFGADGEFGPETSAAVSSFQADSGLKGQDLDGVVGPKTMAALDRRGLSYPGPGVVGTAGAVPGVGPGGLTVTVPGRIRAASTPETMLQDRIPPRVDTPVELTVTGFTTPMAPLTLSIAGASAANGTATINGGATHNVTASGAVLLQGGTQTSPGNGGNLNLVATQGTTEIARSAPFSVSAVPQFYTDTFSSELTGTDRGFVVQDGWESDSGAIGDLDQADISEQVEVTTSTGCFAGVPGGVSSYLPADTPTLDTHRTATALLTSPGRRITEQTSMFRDKRSGAVDIPMRNSGFELDRRCPSAGGGFRLITTKKGKATTANGVPSGQGEGTITRNQAV